MSQIPVVFDHPVADARAMPPMTWSGSMVGPRETATHYLHISAFPCEKCNGPVIAGWLGTRHDDISQETNIRKVGAACISCGFMSEAIAEPSVDHRFRPVEWKWAIQAHAEPEDSSADGLAAELSLDADTK